MTKILVRRLGALGDVLLTTPIVARLRKQHGSDVIIDVETGCPQAYEGNPHVSNVFHPGQPVYTSYDKLLNLDMAYEMNPRWHVVDAYMQLAFEDQSGSKRVVFGIEPPPPADLRRQSRIVTIHAAASWPSRTFSTKWWDQVIKGLVDRGYIITMLGAGYDYTGVDCLSYGPPGSVNSLVGKTTLRGTAEEISRSVCFIACDSSLLHLAGCTDTPIVGLFTSVKSEYRLPYRHNVLGWNCAAMTPRALSCYGCLAEQPIPSTNLVCKRGDNICVSSIDAHDVVAQVEILA